MSSELAHQEFAELKAEVADLKANPATEVAGLKSDNSDVRAETRVTKHDVANLRDMFAGLGQRIDKLDEKLASKIDALTIQLTGLNLQLQRGLGFFAGVSAVVTIAGGFLLALAPSKRSAGPCCWCLAYMSAVSP